jgi:CRP/FNR family cyclic AMP-dependent transcriptional regulator
MFVAIQAGYINCVSEGGTGPEPSYMKRPYDLTIQDNCRECGLSGKGFFCQPNADDLERFEAIKVTRAYPKGRTLFAEGQPALGVYMLCHGSVKLSTCSPDGKIIILDIAEPGEILGLSAAVNGSDHETTAEVVESCQINYVKTPDLLRFLRKVPEASFNALLQLSRNYQTAYRQVCAIGLSNSVGDKLAKLFLGWSGSGSGNGIGNGGVDSVRLKNFHTHAEMAEMIGTSRETVTRALRHFRERGLVTFHGSNLIIHDRKQLKAVIGTRMSKPKTHENNGDVFS